MNEAPPPSAEAATSDVAPTPEQAPSPPAPTSEAPIADKAVRAGVWALVSFGTSQLIRLASNVILTRLLFAEAFGLMALITVFMSGLALFSDVGTNRALVQNKRGEERTFLDTAWTIGVIRGVILSAIAWAAAVPLAKFYDAPQLETLLPIVGLNAAITGLASTKLFTANRRFAQKKLAMIEVGSQVFGVLVMVPCAYYWRSVWALVAGNLAGVAFRAFLSHVMLPGEMNRLRINRTDAREIVELGRWIFVSTALSFLGSQADRLVFGKLVDLDTLGVYNIALTLATMPAAALAHLTWNVLFPVISRAFEQGDDPNPAFIKARHSIFMLGGVMTSALIGAGPFIIDALYDDRYTQAGWMLRILAINGWLAVLQGSLTSAVIARGKAIAPALSNGTKVVTLIVAVTFGHRIAGFPGAMGGLVLVQIVGWLVLSEGARRVGIKTFRHDVATSLRVAASAGAGIACGYVLEPYLPGGVLGDIAGTLVTMCVTTSFWLYGAGDQLRKLRTALQR